MQTFSHSAEDGIEALRNLLAAEAWDEASSHTLALGEALERGGSLAAAGAVATETLRSLPPAHPGYAATNLQSNYGNPVVDLFMRIGNRVIAQSDEAGAWPQLYAATMPDVKSGEFFGPSGMFGLRGPPHRDTPTRAASDDETARRLWEVSEKLTGVTYPL